MRIANFVCGLILIFSISTFAGKVRTLPASSKEMSPVYLKTGRSTILRFSSIPKKVIIGNQNYFNVEFIDSDVTLQPLASTTSNMFVYGDGFTYGFILNVNQTSDYDDLVFVKSKAVIDTVSEAPKKAATMKDLRFTIVQQKKSKIDLQGGVFKWSDTLKSYYTDVFLSHKIQASTQTEKINIQLFNGSQEISFTKPVFEKDKVTENEKARVRLFAKVSSKMKLKVKVQIEGVIGVMDIVWKN